MDSCLIIGNGINRCCGGISWDDLLSEIARNYFLSNDKAESSTLAFEQLRNVTLSRNINVSKDTFAIRFLKELNNINQQKFNEIFIKFKSLSIENLLTTNFDYAIEKVFVNDFSYENYTHKVVMPQETKCSRIRHTKIDDKTRIFHIHGELGKQSTVCLGYVHYATNLNCIMSNILDYDKITDSYSLKEQVFNEEIISWAQFFFTHNIYIVGLGFYECDMDLWWLIAYRQELKLTGDNRIKNKIVYYYLYERKNQGFKDCLEAMGVEVRECEIVNENWEESYIKVAEDIKTNLGEQ